MQDNKLSTINKPVTPKTTIFNQSIQKYLDIEGIPYSQEGHYLRLRDHDSLVVDTRISEKKPYETWFWNSRGVGGNLYNFLVTYQHMNRHQAYETLSQLSPELAKAKVHHVKIEKYNPNKWKPSLNNNKARNYLTNVRQLNPKLVDALFKMKITRELRNGDLYFSWLDKNMREVGGDVQGTTIDYQRFGKRGTRKMIAKGSAKDFGFNFRHFDGSGNLKLYIFESPIDALSFYNLHPNLKGDNYYLSLNGAGTKVKTITAFFKQIGIPKEVHLAMDTDDAGFKGMIHAHHMLKPINKSLSIEMDQMKVYFDQPNSVYKDWNDALKAKDRNVTVENIDQFTNRKIKENGKSWFKEEVKEFAKGNLGNDQKQPSRKKVNKAIHHSKPTFAKPKAMQR